MNKLPRKEAFKVWQKHFDHLEKEFFKVETLQHYLGENESIPGLEDYLNGDKEAGKQKLQQYADNQELRDSFFTKNKESGKVSVRSIRIRVIERPLHPYLEFEIEHYRHVNIPYGGEDIFLIEKDNVPAEILNLGDFVIFDKAIVADSNYSPEGRLESIDFKETEVETGDFLTARKIYLELAVPLSEYKV